MENFEFVSPTHFVFGRRAEEQVGAKLSEAGARRVLVHFGGESARRSGLIDRVCASLDAAGVEHIELGGVRPNPEITLVREGVRLCKYEYEDGLMGSMSNDYVIYRYADVLMMEGECLVRFGKVDEALPLFNEVRRRAGVPEYTAAELTLDEILAERGREFAFEGLRRQDQIRFGTYLGSWDFKEPSDETRKLFPIPSWVMAANPTLVQNPGY